MDIEAVAPELREPLRRLPTVRSDLAWMRVLTGAAMHLMRPTRVDGVALSVVKADGASVRVYRPERVLSDAALLWIHGGGLLIGAAITDDRFCGETARELGITVVSVEYRLAPRHPFPAAHDDCLAAWRWLHAHAGEFGVDPARIAVGGESAGGGLAAALVQHLHDLGESPAAQWLFCPMLDDRTAANRELDAIDHFVWNNRLNRSGWTGYLGSAGADAVPDYSVPARRVDLAALPPAWIMVGDIELFRDEDVDYVRRLRAAGVDTTLVEVPGAPHGFENWAWKTPLAQRTVADARAWLRTTLATGAGADADTLA